MHPSSMSPPVRLRTLLARLGVGQSEWARLMGVTVKTVQRWVAEPAVDLPGPVALWVVLLETDPTWLPELRALAAERDGAPVKPTGPAGRPARPVDAPGPAPAEQSENF